MNRIRRIHVHTLLQVLLGFDLVLRYGSAAGRAAGEPPLLSPWAPRSHESARFYGRHIQQSTTVPSDMNDRALEFLSRRRSNESPMIRPHEASVASTATLTRTFWPPWPFNMINRSNRLDNDTTDLNPSAAMAVWKFTKSSTQFGVRTLQEIGSQLWFHSPPAFPPLVVYALFPRRLAALPITATVAPNALTNVALNPLPNPSVLSTWLRHSQIPLWSNPVIRHAVMAGTGLALVSWAHAEWHRHRTLTPLPLVYRDINRALLPPFLPDQVPVPFAALELPDSGKHNKDGSRLAMLRQRVSLPRLISKWRANREQTKAERHNAHRLAVYKELVALRSAEVAREKRAMTHPHARHSKSDRAPLPPRFAGWHWNPFVLWQRYTSHIQSKQYHQSADPLGYALVTGASAGIGRAICVELARWKIPLILVARDVHALTELAIDLEACYGVDCCVLSADLSQPDTADRIYEAVTDAGLQVDVLVNNAGISSHGESLNLSPSQVENMIQVNGMAVSKLTHFFGRDMKLRQRGRILIVSSICGAVDGIATVAVYSATKAFENSLGVSMSKELEPYGVGLTCLLPGAVRGTEFRSRSDSQEALCWKLPFYAKTAASVAESGVRAMLRGDTEVTPGVLNRIFLKGLKPIMPQRLHNLLAEIMWNPLERPFRRKKKGLATHESAERDSKVDKGRVDERPRRLIIRPSSSRLTKKPRILEFRAPSIEELTSFVVADEGSNDTVVPAIVNNYTDTSITIAETPTALVSAETTPTLTNVSANNSSAIELDIAPTPSPENSAKSPTEIELLLEQYKRHRLLDPFGEKHYYRDPLTFRLEALVDEGKWRH